MSLPKPDHLDVPPGWLAGRVAAVVALGLGAVAFIAGLMTQDRPWSAPDLRIGVPVFAAAAIAALISLARHERAYGLWLGGLGLAGAALVLGWFLMFAIVIGATALAIAILHAVL